MTATPSAKAAKRRRWPRRLLWLLLVLLGLRALLPLLLPWLANLVAGAVGLRVDWRSSSLSLSGLDVVFDGLNVAATTDDATAPPLLEVRHLHADLAALALLRGKIVVEELVVAGLRTRLRRGADGAWLLPASLRGGDPPATAPVPTPTTAPGALRFDLPVRVDHARIDDARLRLEDAGGQAPLELVADLRIDDLGGDGRQARIELRATSPQMVDRFHVLATGSNRADAAEFELRAEVRGLRPEPLAAWWPSPAITPIAKALGAELTVRASATRTPDDPAAAALETELQLATSAEGVTTLSLPRLHLRVDELRADRAGGIHIEIAGLSVEPVRHPDGTWQLGGVRLGRPAGASAAAPLSWPIRDLGLTIGPLATGPGSTTSFVANGHIDGWLDALSIRDGVLVIGEDHAQVTASLQATGIAVAALQPLWRDQGLSCDWPTADVGLHVVASRRTPGDGAPALSFAVRDLAVGHGTDRLSVSRLVLDQVAVRADGALEIGALQVAGPQVPFERRADGSLYALGWHLAAAAASSEAPARTAGPAPGPPALPRLLVHDLTWTDAALQFTDRSLAEPASLRLEGLALAGRDLAVGIADVPDGTATLQARVPGAVDAVRLELHTTARDGGTALTGTLNVDGITGNGWQPWLQREGVRALLQHGQFRGDFDAHLRAAEGGLQVGAELRAVALRDGQTAWVELASATVRGLRLTGSGIDLGAIAVHEPRVLVVRRADGGLDLAGLALPAPAAAPAGTATPPPPPSPRAADRGDTPWRLARLDLLGAALEWRDAARQPEAALSAALDVHLDALAPGDAAAPTQFAIALTTDSGRTHLRLDGELVADPRALRVQAELRGEGLRGYAVQPWLPAGHEVTLQDGTATAALSLAADAGPDGSRSVRFELRDLALHDGPQPLFQLDLLRADLPQIAADASAVHLAELRLAGLRTAVSRQDGRLQLPGVRLPAAASAPAVAAATAAPHAPFALPQLQIDRVDLELAQLRWTDSGGTPLDLSARLTTTAPWRSDPADPSQSPPLTLRLDAAAPPLCRSGTLDISLLPLLIEPRLQAELHLAGIATTALAALAPGTAGAIQGTIAEGELRGVLELELDLRRRRPEVFDFTRAFGGQLRITALTLRDRPDGELLAGVAALDARARTVDPHDGTVLLHSVWIDTPTLHAVRHADAIELLGLRIATGPTAGANEAGRAPTVASDGELAIDSLIASGLDLQLTDRTTDPPTLLPLDGLDLEVLNWSSAGRHEPRPFSFQAALRGGPVPLPPRTTSSSLFAGVLTSAGHAVLGGGHSKPEPRPWFEELFVRGQVQVFPRPTGRIQTDLVGLELLALRPYALGAGVEIGDGVLDARNATTLGGARGHDVSMRLRTTWLSLSEPPGGPISTYLKLPAPLDTVLFLLRNDADEHYFPLDFHLDAAGSPHQVADAAAGALATAIAEAVARSPLRAAGMLTGLLGLGGAPEDLEPWRRQVEFAPGEAIWPKPADDVVALARKLASDDQLSVVLDHAFGRADLERARARANPPVATLHALIARLRQQRAELQARRQAEAARTWSLFAAGQQQAGQEAALELRALAAHLGDTESALDRALAQLRPGERGAERRTRAAALEIAELRLKAAAAWLRSQLPAAAVDRVEVRAARWAVGEGPGKITLTPRRRAPGG